MPCIRCKPKDTTYQTRTTGICEWSLLVFSARQRAYKTGDITEFSCASDGAASTDVSKHAGSSDSDKGKEVFEDAPEELDAERGSFNDYEKIVRIFSVSCSLLRTALAKWDESRLGGLCWMEVSSFSASSSARPPHYERNGQKYSR
jgi:hypothetical protein